MPAQMANGAKVRVASVRFTGNTVFSSAALHDVVASHLGRDLAFPQLQLMADEVTRYYRDRGYPVSRAYLPAQHIERGELEIAIVEGRYGKVVINKQVRLADYPTGVLNPIRSGDVVRTQELEESLLLLNDLAGLEVDAALQPGTVTGTTDLNVNLRNGPRFTGSLDIDNYGSRYTGTHRAGLTLNLNNPSALGDQLSVRAMFAGRGMGFGRVGYVAPVGSAGTKLGLGYSYLEYALGQELKPLELQGSARIASVALTHPLLRSRSSNIFGQASFEHKNLEESFLDVTTSRDQLRVVSLSLSGDRRYASGIGNYGVAVSQGVGGYSAGLLSDNDPEASRVNTGGRFSKLTFDATHLQRLNPSIGLVTHVAGQLSTKSLLSTEQFSAGGPQAVRAYPQGEALGDNGYMASVELRWNRRELIPENLGLGERYWGDLLEWSLFFERGESSLNEPLPGQDRSRQLQGAGVGLTLGLRHNYMAKAVYALPIQPTDDLTAERRLAGRFWFQLVKWF